MVQEFSTSFFIKMAKILKFSDKLQQAKRMLIYLFIYFCTNLAIRYDVVEAGCLQIFCGIGFSWS